MKTLKQKTVSGVKWQLINKIGQKVISVLTFAVLARILEPSTFGLFAMAFILIDGFAIFQSMGIDSGIIQRKELSQPAKDTAYVLIQSSGLLMFLLCYFSASWAGKFFSNQNVAEIIKALGFIFVMSCFARVPQALLIKDMRFKLISSIEIAATVVNSAAAILFAMISPTIWSLVGAYLLKQLTTSISTWYFSRYRFQFKFDRAVAKELLHFGKFLVGLSVVWYINSHIAVTVVGKILGVAALGYFALAKNIGQFINTHFTVLISRVMFPAYASIQNDRTAVKRVYLKTMKFVSMVTVPFGTLLIFMAEEMTLALYGEKWLAIVPLLRIFGIGTLITPLIACAGSAYTACGKPQYSFRVGLLDLGLKIPLMIILTLHYGLIGTAFGGLISMLCTLPLNFYYLKKVIGFSVKDFVGQVIPAFQCAGVMALAIFAIQKVVGPLQVFSISAVEHFFHLSIYGFAALAVYAVSFYLIDKAATLEVRQMLYAKAKNKPTGVQNA